MATARTKATKATRSKSAGTVDLVPRMLVPLRRGDVVEWMVTARHVPLGVAEVVALLEDPRVVERAPVRLELPARRTVAKARGAWAAGDAGAALLANSSALARFRELSLPDAGISPEGARALAASAHLAALRVLDLAGNPLGDDGLVALAGASFQELADLQVATGRANRPAGAKGLASLARAFPHMAQLDLAGHDVAPHAGLLADAAFAGALRALSLRATGVLDAAAAAALGAGRLGAALESLDLTATELGPAALTSLCHGVWPALRRIRWSEQPHHREQPGGAIADLAKLPALAEVAMADALAHDDFRALLETDLPEKLEVVDRLSAFGDRKHVLPAVFRRPWPKLRRLTLRGGGPALQGAQLPALEVLHGDDVKPEGARGLAAANAPRLRELRFVQGALTGAGVSTLLGSLPALESFTVLTDAVDAATLGDLGAPPSVKTLRTLCVALARMDARGVEALLRPGWPALEVLAIDGNPAVGVDGLRAVLALPSASRLTSLDVSETGLDGAAPIAELANAQLPQLRALHLRRNAIGDDGAAALASSTGLAELRFIDLRMSTVGVDGASALAHSAALRGLEEIQLGERALAKGVVVDAPAHRLVGQGLASRADQGLERFDARYY